MAVGNTSKTINNHHTATVIYILLATGAIAGALLGSSLSPEWR